jgi:hypothetical protein
MAGAGVVVQLRAGLHTVDAALHPTTLRLPITEARQFPQETLDFSAGGSLRTLQQNAQKNLNQSGVISIQPDSDL